MEQTKYTVFVERDHDGGGFDCYYSGGGFVPAELQGLIEWVHVGLYTPVAWCVGHADLNAFDHALAESIAAGRVIELVDGKYVPRGVRVASPTPTLDKLENEAEKKEEAETLINGLTAEETDATASVAGIVSKTPLADLRDLVAIQGMDGTWNTDEYMLGLFNGLEMALATMEGRDPQYRTLKPTAPAVPASTAKPALAALSRISSMSHMLGNGIKG